MTPSNNARVTRGSGGRGRDLIAPSLECSVNPDLLGGGITSLKGESILGPVGRILAIGKYTIPTSDKGSIVAVAKYHNAYRPFYQLRRAT